MARISKYIFRGTTINYEGNPNSRLYGYTPASRHPAKATLFALDCYRSFPDSAVVYAGLRETFSQHDITKNVLEKKEDELVFQVLPINFYPDCLGYVPVRKMQELLREIKHPVNDIARTDNLSRLCEEMDILTNKEIENLMRILIPHLKK